LWGLFAFHATRAELRTSEKFGLELLRLGESRNETVLQLHGHGALVNAYYKLGAFQESQEHLERGIGLYNERPCSEVTVEYDDPGPLLLVYGACTLWVLGYPDRSRQAAADALMLARQRGHHLTLAHATHMTGHLSELMDDWEGVRKANDETKALATEWGLSGIKEMVARRERLVLVALHCDPEQMEYKRRHPQPGFARSLHDTVLARAYGRRGQPEEGLRILEGTEAWSDATGSRFFDAEVYRTRGELLLLSKRLDEAEHSYRRAVEVAREQTARMWELRAVCDFARRLRGHRRGTEAYSLLAPVYSWFSEGFDARDLQVARALLDTLCPSPETIESRP
jgi:tetratricopeptide (TPR) repeat protein